MLNDDIDISKGQYSGIKIGEMGPRLPVASIRLSKTGFM